jgi:type VI secretion system protein ImpA
MEMAAVSGVQGLGVQGLGVQGLGVQGLGVDAERLLAPVSPDRPAGEDLRYTEVYAQIQEARREEDPSLPQGVWQAKLKRADWPAVSALCADALASRSKDLQIAAWLLEARFHQEGLPGVRAGLALLRELSARYWEGLFPGGPADHKTRLSPIHWLNEKFAPRLRHIPVAVPANGGSQVYTVADWEEAVRRGDKEQKEQKERIRQGAAGSPRRFYVDLLECLEGTSEEATRLEGLLRERCGSDEPSLGRLKEHLTTAQRVLASFQAEYHGAADPAAPEPPPPPPPTPGPPPPAPAAGAASRDSAESADAADVADAAEAEAGAAPGARFRTRDEAYQLLAEIAEFLLRAEPHSPTPYLIKRAVAWGQMPLAEVLQELVRDPNDLRAAYSLLGIEGRDET